MDLVEGQRCATLRQRPAERAAGDARRGERVAEDVVLAGTNGRVAGAVAGRRQAEVGPANARAMGTERRAVAVLGAGRRAERLNGGVGQDTGQPGVAAADGRIERCVALAGLTDAKRRARDGIGGTAQPSTYIRGTLGCIGAHTEDQPLVVHAEGSVVGALGVAAAVLLAAAVSPDGAGGADGGTEAAGGEARLEVAGGADGLASELTPAADFTRITDRRSVGAGNWIGFAALRDGRAGLAVGAGEHIAAPAVEGGVGGETGTQRRGDEEAVVADAAGPALVTARQTDGRTARHDRGADAILAATGGAGVTGLAGLRGGADAVARGLLAVETLTAVHTRAPVFAGEEEGEALRDTAAEVEAVVVSGAGSGRAKFVGRAVNAAAGHHAAAVAAKVARGAVGVVGAVRSRQRDAEVGIAATLKVERTGVAGRALRLAAARARVAVLCCVTGHAHAAVDAGQDVRHALLRRIGARADGGTEVAVGADRRIRCAIDGAGAIGACVVELQTEVGRTTALLVVGAGLAEAARRKAGAVGVRIADKAGVADQAGAGVVAAEVCGEALEEHRVGRHRETDRAARAGGVVEARTAATAEGLARSAVDTEVVAAAVFVRHAGAADNILLRNIARARAVRTARTVGNRVGGRAVSRVGNAGVVGASGRVSCLARLGVAAAAERWKRQREQEKNQGAKSQLRRPH